MHILHIVVRLDDCWDQLSVEPNNCRAQLIGNWAARAIVHGRAAVPVLLHKLMPADACAVFWTGLSNLIEAACKLPQMLPDTL